MLNEENKWTTCLFRYLADKSPSQHDNRFKFFLKNRVPNSIYFQPPSINEIVNSIVSLNVNKAVGHNNIPRFFLKTFVYTIAPYLFILLTYAFQHCIFPDNCKIVKVIPIYKSGEKKNPSNYRPISILTSFSKIIEKLVFKQITNFLDKNNVLIPYQYGFQKSISTAHAIIDIITTSLDNINNKNYTGLFFLDLKKAFDTVCHKTLVAKLDQTESEVQRLSSWILFWTENNLSL